MRVEIQIDPALSEPRLVLQAPELTDELAALARRFHALRGKRVGAMAADMARAENHDASAVHSVILPFKKRNKTPLTQCQPFVALLKGENPSIPRCHLDSGPKTPQPDTIISATVNVRPAVGPLGAALRRPYCSGARRELSPPSRRFDEPDLTFSCVNGLMVVLYMHGDRISMLFLPFFRKKINRC